MYITLYFLYDSFFSLACMIQMSTSTKTALEKFPQLLIRERGEMTIKVILIKGIKVNATFHFYFML